MKHMKMLGLLVMAAASLMAFASSASAAPTLTSPSGTEYTGELSASLTPKTSALLKAGIEVTCTTSSVKGKVETNTETSAAGKISALSFGTEATPCNQHVTVEFNGDLTVHPDGTVTGKGTRVKIVVTSLGITCFYGTEGTTVTLGTLTGGTPAVMDINTTQLPRLSGSNTFFCAEKGTWTGSYTVTTPGTLLLK